MSDDCFDISLIKLVLTALISDCETLLSINAVVKKSVLLFISSVNSFAKVRI